MRPFAACGLACFLALLAGCKAKEFNPHVSTESEILENPIQLTHGFDKAGEAYFSPDMSWIIFQACPSGEPRYQMYVAPVKWSFIDEPMPPGPKRYNTPLPGGLTMPRQDNILGIGWPVRISPKNSRNTCGFFSPDGNSLIFGSTSGKEDPGELFPWDALAKRRLALPSPTRDLIDPYWTDAGFLLALERFGYDVTDEQKAVIAFQRRFRPDLIDGIVDGECRAKLLALLLPRPQ